MKTNNVKSQSYIDFHMKSFKQTVRAIKHDLECEPDYQYFCNSSLLTDEEKKALDRLIEDFKEEAVQIYRGIKYGWRLSWNESEIYQVDHYEKYLDHFLTSHCCQTIWLRDEFDDPKYNSVMLNFDELVFMYKEIDHDNFLCEMAETHGIGYDMLEAQYDVEEEQYDLLNQCFDDECIEDLDEDLPF